MTSKREWTAGPWRLFLTRDGQTLIGIGELNGAGITDCGFGTWRSGEEQLANARLIAAAPDLYEALADLRFVLKLAAAKYDFDLTGSEAIARADAALARAGREP